MFVPLIIAILAASLSSGVNLTASRSERSVDTQLTLLGQMVTDLHTEVKSTTAELAVVKSTLLSTTSQLTNELNNLSAVIKPVPTGINITVLDTISSDVKNNIGRIDSLRDYVRNLEIHVSNMNATEDTLNLKQQSLESKVDTVALQQDITRSQVENISAKVENISAVMDYKIEGLEDKQNVTESEITVLSKKYDATESSIDLMRREINETKTNMDHLTPNVKYDVRLEAYDTYEIPINDGETLKFDSIWNNDGDGYNFTTGRFTAPVSGTYLLWANVFNQNGTIDIELIINGNSTVRGTTNTGDGKYDTAVLTLVTDLVDGDQVWYEKFSGHGETIFGILYSSMGGVLLHTN